MEEAEENHIEENPESRSSDEKRSHLKDQQCLEFLDSLDVDSLSLALRQGWFDLASARHSMGVTHVNGSLLDRKPVSAPTSLSITPCHHLN